MKTEEAIKLLEDMTQEGSTMWHQSEALWYAIEHLNRYQWQGMATAPKDENYVLIALQKGNAKRCVVAQYLNRERADLQGWYTHNLSYYGCDVVRAWMPLPEFEGE